MGEMELTKGLKRVGRLDLIGGGQVVVDGNYAYVGHMKPPHGTSIIDAGMGGMSSRSSSIAGACSSGGRCTPRRR